MKIAREEIKKSDLKKAIYQRETGKFDKAPEIFKKPTPGKEISTYNDNLRNRKEKTNIRSSLASKRSKYQAPTRRDMVNNVKELQTRAGMVKNIDDLQGRVGQPPRINQPSPAAQIIRDVPEYKPPSQQDMVDNIKDLERRAGMVKDIDDLQGRVPRQFDTPPNFDIPPDIYEPSPASRIQDEMDIDKPADSGWGRTAPPDVPPQIKEPQQFDTPPDFFDTPPNINEPSPASRIQDGMDIDEPTPDSGWGRTVPPDTPSPPNINEPSPASRIPKKSSFDLPPNAMVVYDVDVEGGIEDVRDMQTRALGNDIDASTADADLKWRAYKRKDAAARQVAGKQLVKKGYSVDIGLKGDKSTGRISKTTKRSVNPMRRFISLFLKLPI